MQFSVFFKKKIIFHSLFANVPNKHCRITNIANLTANIDIKSLAVHTLIPHRSDQGSPSKDIRGRSADMLSAIFKVRVRAI